ncbi:MAG: hypothetical protein O2954_11670 [bacterium]|nr:hypothetical protein [bacterium]
MKRHWLSGFVCYALMFAVVTFGLTACGGPGESPLSADSSGSGERVYAAKGASGKTPPGQSSNKGITNNKSSEMDAVSMTSADTPTESASEPVTGVIGYKNSISGWFSPDKNGRLMVEIPDYGNGNIGHFSLEIA